jgi:hypothetical protein
MSTQGSESLRFRFVQALHGSFGPACLLFLLIFSLRTDSAAQLDQAVARSQKAFLEVWLHRSLGNNALRQVIDEFNSYCARQGCHNVRFRRSVLTCLPKQFAAICSGARKKLASSRGATYQRAYAAPLRLSRLCVANI